MNWIEINEERSNLPELCSEVLVTLAFTYGDSITMLSYFDGDGTFYDLQGMTNLDHRVIAWMYIPKPFKK